MQRLALAGGLRLGSALAVGELVVGLPGRHARHEVLAPFPA